MTGQCVCRENSAGRTCDVCSDGFYRPESVSAYTALCIGGCLFNPAAVCQGKLECTDSSSVKFVVSALKRNNIH